MPWCCGTGWDTAGCSWCLLAFPHTCPAPLRNQNCWDLCCGCFVSSLTAWAKFLCLPVLLFSLSAQLLQIFIFWLPYRGFVLPDLDETTFTTQCRNWHVRTPACSCCSLWFQAFMFHLPLCSIWVSDLHRIPRLLLQAKTPALFGYLELKTVSGFHTGLT